MGLFTQINKLKTGETQIEMTPRNMFLLEYGPMIIIIFAIYALYFIAPVLGYISFGFACIGEFVAIVCYDDCPGDYFFSPYVQSIATFVFLFLLFYATLLLTGAVLLYTGAFLIFVPYAIFFAFCCSKTSAFVCVITEAYESVYEDYEKVIDK